MPERQRPKTLTELALRRYRSKPWYPWIWFGFSLLWLAFGVFHSRNALRVNYAEEGIIGGCYIGLAVANLMVFLHQLRFYRFLRWADAQQAGASGSRSENPLRVTP